MYAGDKQKIDKQGRQAARPIVVGLALRRIAGRVPCAQMRSQFAELFTKYRQLGIAVPGGVESAWHTVDSAITRFEAEADGDVQDMPVVTAWDSSDAFPNSWRSTLFDNTAKHFPELLRYTAQCYDGEGNIFAVQDSIVVKQWVCSNGVWQGDPLGVHHMLLSILNFLDALVQKCNPGRAFAEPTEEVAAVTVGIVDDLTQVVLPAYLACRASAYHRHTQVLISMQLQSPH